MQSQHKRFFMQRFETMKEAAITHPYAKWVAVIDPSSDPACCALHGRVWQVKGSALSDAIAAHLDSNIKSCRCRLSPLQQSGQAEDELAYRAQRAASMPPTRPTKKELKRKAAAQKVIRESAAAANARAAPSPASKESWIERLKRGIGLK